MTEQFTEADVQLVSTAINAAQAEGLYDEVSEWAARALSALAEAGRLAHDDFLRAFHAPLVAELRAFGVPTADTDPLAGVRALIGRARDLEARLRDEPTDAQALAVLEALGWPDDREGSAHVEDGGYAVTPAGHYWETALEVARAVIDAGGTP